MKNDKKKVMKVKEKRWRKPKVQILRLGFEITMYVDTDPGGR